MLKENLSSLIIFLILYLNIPASDGKEERQSKDRPNVVILIADDFGIGDLGCYGNNTINTPNIDKLSRDGVTLHHHLSVAALCTPSRAALLTGRYPARYGMAAGENTPPVIVHVASNAGLPEEETTIAEVFSASGYSTAFVGKWHLGSGCGWFGRHCKGPLQHGFDSFFGLLLSLIVEIEGEYPFWVFDLNDSFYQSFLGTFVVSALSAYILRRKKFVYFSFLLCFICALVFPVSWFVYTHYRLHTPSWWQVSSWMLQHLDGVVVRDGSLVHRKAPLDSIFEDFLNESVSFIQHSSKAGKPFFLVHSFAHVHVPMFSSEAHRGRSKHGRYGDNVEEMDTGVGRILETLREEGLDSSTLVYFTSDHGGHLEAISELDGQREGGYNKLFKGGKGMGAPEGAMRVPGLFRWSGVLPESSSMDYPSSHLDILPTFLELAGIPSIKDFTSKEIDGLSLAPLLKKPQLGGMQKRVLIHHCRMAIHALRIVTDSKVYKMYLYLHRWKANSTQCGWGSNELCGCFGDDVIDVRDRPVLYELKSDPYEDRPIDRQTKEYKKIVDELNSYLRKWREDVVYPESQYSSKFDNILGLWRQPFF